MRNIFDHDLCFYKKTQFIIFNHTASKCSMIIMNLMDIIAYRTHAAVRIYSEPEYLDILNLSFFFSID